MTKMKLAIIIVTIVALMCCNKTIERKGSYTLYLVNGGIGSGLTSNFKSMPLTMYGSRNVYYVHTGQQITIADTASLASPLVSKEFAFFKGTYSIFVVGQSPNFETIIKEESDLPFISQSKIYSTLDSVVNVRFINLSPNSTPLKIKVSNSTVNEVDNLAFKDISSWRSFKATSSSSNYSLQIRNASTDALISTYTLTANAVNRFKNVTLMIRGIQGITVGASAFGVTAINYF